GVLELEDLPAGLDGDLLGEVAIRDRGGDVGDVAHLVGEVRRHPVHGRRQPAPRPAHAFDLGLAAEPALRSHFGGDSGDLVGEGGELVDHRVDGVLELEHLAADVDGDLLGQVAVRDGRGHLGDVPHLAGEVVRHEVDVVGQVLPGPRHAGDVGLAAEDPLRAHFAGDAGDLVREGRELVDHRVDGVLELEDLAARLDGDLPREVALRDRGGDIGDVADLVREVVRELVHVV